MANKWNYKHGTLLPNGISFVNAPDDNVQGVNVRYVDKNNPLSSDTAANRGSANVPYNSIQKALTDLGVSATVNLIVAKGVYSVTSVSTVGIIADNILNVVVDGGGVIECKYGKNTNNQFSSGIIFTNFTGMAFGDLYKHYYCIRNHYVPIVRYFQELNGLILKNTVGDGLYMFTYDVITSINCNRVLYSLLHNCVYNPINATYIYNNVFWLGTINYNSLTSDLNTICPLIGTTYPTENDAIAKVETDLGLAANTLKNNGFRLLNPHFINMSKGNFNIDWLNYDCTAILALRDAWDWIINRGVRCEYPTDFVGAVGAGFGEEPNLSDGFSGELYSRNINSSGVITNTAYDTVLVSKKYILPTAYTLENINFFDKLISTAFELNATTNDGTDTPNCYTFYLIGVKAGVLESVFNSTNNTFSYSSGVLTCDFPRFMWNRSTELNKDDNTIYGQIENGTFDLDYMRNIFKAGVKEFRIIAVKKGV